MCPTIAPRYLSAAEAAQGCWLQTASSIFFATFMVLMSVGAAAAGPCGSYPVRVIRDWPLSSYVTRCSYQHCRSCRYAWRRDRSSTNESALGKIGEGAASAVGA